MSAAYSSGRYHHQNSTSTVTINNGLDGDIQLFERIRKSVSPTPSEISSSAESLEMDAMLSDKLNEFISSTLKKFFSVGDNLNIDLTKYDSIYMSLDKLKSSNEDKKIEILSKILDDHYSEIFGKSVYCSSLNEKLLLGLNFLEAKIQIMLQHNNFAEIRTTESDKREIVSKAFQNLNIQFHNYEKAIEYGENGLLHYWELPFPWRENKFIVFGYRFNNKFSDCVRSIFAIHNETGNIWTHIIGLIIIMYLAFIHFPSTNVFHSFDMTEIIIIYCFLISSIKCLTSSVCWHTFNSTSVLPVRSRFACVDYAGITVLITASIITTEHCALYYYPKPRHLIMLVSLIAGISGFGFIWSPTFDTPRARPFRIFFFVSLATMGAASFIILSFFKGFTNTFIYYSPLVKSLASYIIGVIFYGLLIPERFRKDVIVDDFDICDEILNELNTKDDLENHFKVPDKIENHDKFSSLYWVDYAFSSHNIWHTFVVGGIVGHYFAILEMFNNINVNKPI
ncbi:hypothetical protein PACTADRAFT_51385 [Pachysolen tannophilus NRRL Y-2460]|uniref:ADIPOR-like receptor IZH3 n=1 Tax=Pachysolen tannophilus NRRL Y-2460 TaxID=669874 RepID=A0A1E4TPB5_PACTA|nr:hypothetical protein PACTADRAFT_51385 [Pachysolen tannophilus NRRL Y-2460]